MPSFDTVIHMQLSPLVNTCTIMLRATLASLCFRLTSNFIRKIVKSAFLRHPLGDVRDNLGDSS